MRGVQRGHGERLPHDFEVILSTIRRLKIVDQWIVPSQGEAVRRTSCWLLGDVMCLLYIHIVSMISCASVGNIVLISLDRYVAICYPLHYHRRITVTRIRLCIIMVIIVLYTRVFVVAIFQARAIRSSVTAVSLQRSTTVGKSELKAARTLGILVVVFLICFCPFHCAALGGDVSFNTSVAVLCLSCISSCLNPLIYAMFYPWFRKSIKHIVTLKIFQSGSSKANIM
ncbi:trace amine-associated receptor 1-like [Xiphophorus hellerii]|uniref:trace amine-associated receptor 1-like n=1 Tax=Xiphophorus hellerii TaxID=8084 RepID=UPI0013B46549|nr:trace amine-associated receptor 1-like [Xiphophorus hellerii]